MPEIKRISIVHALNQKAVARRAAKDLGEKYEDINLIVVHMGGGISVGAHKNGRIIDVNYALDGGRSILVGKGRRTSNRKFNEALLLRGIYIRRIEEKSSWQRRTDRIFRDK